MKRRLLNLLTALSLLLCLATVALWARSYFRSDCLTYSQPTLEPELFRASYLIGVSGRGNAWVAFDWTEHEYHPTQPSPAEVDLEEETESPPTAGWEHETDRPEDVSEHFDHRAWGFGFEVEPRSRWQSPPGYHRWAVAFPLWAAAAAFAALPAARLFRRVRRRRRAAAGVCSRCGYDLRATPGRCPECGTTGGGTVKAMERAAAGCVGGPVAAAYSLDS